MKKRFERFLVDAKHPVLGDIEMPGYLVADGEGVVHLLSWDNTTLRAFGMERDNDFNHIEFIERPCELENGQLVIGELGRRLLALAIENDEIQAMADQLFDDGFPFRSDPMPDVETADWHTRLGQQAIESFLEGQNQ